MAKNKKRKHRTPIAPPIHSAPGTARPAARPPAGASPDTPSASPPAPESRRPASKPRSQTQSARAAARKRKARRRTYLIVGTVVALLIAAILIPRIMSGRKTNEFNTIAKPFGCSKIETTGDSGASDHLSPGEKTTYDPLPPSHGAHDASTLPAGVYDEPLSDDPGEDVTLYKAVHSLEHGAVIVWHDQLTDDEVDELDRAFRDEEKVLVVPFPQLRGDTRMALTAWGRRVTCEEPSTEVVEQFVELFRSARTAPEPNNAI